MNDVSCIRKCLRIIRDTSTLPDQILPNGETAASTAFAYVQTQSASRRRRKRKRALAKRKEKTKIKQKNNVCAN